MNNYFLSCLPDNPVNYEFYYLLRHGFFQKGVLSYGACFGMLEQLVFVRKLFYSNLLVSFFSQRFCNEWQVARVYLLVYRSIER